MSVESVAHTLRLAVRKLGRSPGFTFVAILSLALGIGANTAIFTLVNRIFLQDPGIAEPERVVQIYRQVQSPYWSITWGDYRSISDDLGDVFSHVMASRPAATSSLPTKLSL